MYRITLGSIYTSEIIFFLFGGDVGVYQNGMELVLAVDVNCNNVNFALWSLF